MDNVADKSCVDNPDCIAVCNGNQDCISQLSNMFLPPEVASPGSQIRLNLDPLGSAYFSLVVITSFFLGLGLLVLWKNKNTRAIRMRNVALITVAVIPLHAYLTLILLHYVVPGGVHCRDEFWLMSILLPTGIALFQACNFQLLTYSEAQKKLLEAKKYDNEVLGLRSQMRKFASRCLTPGGLCRTWRRASWVERSYMVIGLMIVLNLLLTAFLYCADRRFHSTLGLWGEAGNIAQCRRGWIWMPSIIWQFTWSWIVGIFILVKNWKIKDNHYWRLQTLVAVVTGSFGTPLWVGFLYGPRLQHAGISQIDQKFPPAGWFMPSLICMEFSLVIFPILNLYRAVRSSRRMKEQFDPQLLRIRSPLIHSNRNLYTMHALEATLAMSSEKLQVYASTKELSGENVMFLVAVRKFRQHWHSSSGDSSRRPSVVLMRDLPREAISCGDEIQIELGSRAGSANLEGDSLQDLFKEAALIFFQLMNPRTARFPVNLSHSVYRKVQDIFKEVGYRLDTSAGSSMENLVTPWDEESAPGEKIQSKDSMYEPSDTHKLYLRGSERSEGQNFTVPRTFSVHVFDEAYEAIKYDVFTNTWAKMVDSLAKHTQHRVEVDGNGTDVESNHTELSEEDRHALGCWTYFYPRSPPVSADGNSHGTEDADSSKLVDFLSML